MRREVNLRRMTVCLFLSFDSERIDIGILLKHCYKFFFWQKRLTRIALQYTANTLQP